MLVSTVKSFVPKSLHNLTVIRLLLSFDSFNSPSPSSSARLFLSSSHHSVEGPSDIWLSPASRGSRRCSRFWQAGTEMPRGPDGDSWTGKRK